MANCSLFLVSLRVRNEAPCSYEKLKKTKAEVAVQDNKATMCLAKQIFYNSDELGERNPALPPKRETGSWGPDVTNVIAQRSAR